MIQSNHAADPTTCECGATLVHDIAPGYIATLCPHCDRDRLEDNTDDYAATLPLQTQGQVVHRNIEDAAGVKPCRIIQAKDHCRAMIALRSALKAVDGKCDDEIEILWDGVESQSASELQVRRIGYARSAIQESLTLLTLSEGPHRGPESDVLAMRLDADTLEQLDRQANAANRAMRHCVVPHAPITAAEIAKGVLETWAFRRAKGYPNV